MYQHCVVCGRVGRDADSRFTPNGKRVTSFSVATSRKWKDASGVQQEQTTWWKVTTWEKLAEICGEYVKKGMLVLVDGEVSVSAYSAQDGTAKASLELRANNVRFLSKRGETTEAEVAPEDEDSVPF